MQYPTISEYVKASQDASDNLDMSTEATDEELNEAITDEFGVKYSKDGRKLLKAPYKLNGTYSIKEGVRIICDNAFESCTSLSSLVISDSVAGIVIPDGVTSIGDYAFVGCIFVTRFVIPNSVTSIGNHAFEDCFSLTGIVIPNGVTSIGDYAFSSCRSLTNIVIPDSVTSIGDHAFEGCYSLYSIVIPDSVTSIGNHAFEDCYSLTGIVIPDGVTSIGDYAFGECNFPYNLRQELISRFGRNFFW